MCHRCYEAQAISEQYGRTANIIIGIYAVVVVGLMIASYFQSWEQGPVAILFLATLGPVVGAAGLCLALVFALLVYEALYAMVCAGLDLLATLFQR